jgi:hypothetical protein
MYPASRRLQTWGRCEMWKLHWKLPLPSSNLVLVSADVGLCKFCSDMLTGRCSILLPPSLSLPLPLPLLLRLIIILLQSSVILSLFQNCPPLFSVLLHTFPFPTPFFFRSSTDSSHLNLVPLQVECLWFKNRKLSARTHFFHSKEMSQSPQSSSFYHLSYV